MRVAGKLVLALTRMQTLAPPRPPPHFHPHSRQCPTRGARGVLAPQVDATTFKSILMSKSKADAKDYASFIKEVP